MSFAGFSIPTKIVKAGRQAKSVGGLLGAHSVSKAVSKIRKVRRKSEFHSFLPGRSSRKRSQIANPNETGKQRKSAPCGLIPELPRSCRVSSCFALPCPVQSCSVLSSPVLSCRVGRPAADTRGSLFPERMPCRTAAKARGPMPRTGRFVLRTDASEKITGKKFSFLIHYP